MNAIRWPLLSEQRKANLPDGYHRIMDIQPESLHQRTPLFIGSKNMVEKAEELMAKFSAVNA